MSRIKRLSIGSELVLQHMRDGWDGLVRVTDDPVPADAAIVSASIDTRGDVLLTIQSGEFAEVEYGEFIPRLEPRFRRIETKPRSIEAKGPGPLGRALADLMKGEAANAFTAELLKSKAPDRK